MNALKTATKLLATLVLLTGSGYLLYTQAAPLLAVPCEQPITYSVGSFDTRFGISNAMLTAALAKAASVWNTEAGKTVVIAASEGKPDILVNLAYGERQQAVELGETIDSEQAAYDAQKARLNGLKGSFSATKRSYERSAAAYERRSAAHNAEVAEWNAKGGAPAAEYARLNAEADELREDREELNAEAERVNEAADGINDAVTELNRLARQINAKVNVYNESAGEDFDQGNYVADKDGRRITIYEFTDTEDLNRVLTHEFGHALGMGHVENPDSIMYSFNIGEGLDLTSEDVAAFRTLCRLD